jgi:hypothetical protein
VQLSKPFKTLGLFLQEADASFQLSAEDLRSALSDCLNDYYPGKYCYIANIYGDGESGDVVYYCGGQYLRAPYEVGMAAGKRTHSIEVDDAQNVLPRTIYDVEADEDDIDTEMYGGPGMSEAQKTIFESLFVERFPGSAQWKRPFSERFISKKTRDAADDSDFAGSGRSFPILKPSDVKAAVHSIGRGVAGGQKASSIKAGIKRIAKRKGFTAQLPDAWKDDADESVSSWQPDGVLLRESAAFLEAPLVKEGQVSEYPIKLISPGRGTSGYYTSDVLQKAAESKVFKAGTQMFWNHDTDAEESQRPEGDLNRLAAVTTSDATWDESGRDGPGLYARAKVFSDYADKVKEKGPHIGLSIRAGGARDDVKEGPDGKRGVITELRNAHSVDFVTKAGRDGKVFAESAKEETQVQTEEGDMTKEEVQALIKESQAPLIAENKRLREHLALSQTPAMIRESLREIRLPDGAKERIVRRLAESAPIAEDGSVDKKKLGEMVLAEAKAEASYLADLGIGVDPASLGVAVTEAEVVAHGKQHEDTYKEAMESMADLFVGEKLPKSPDPQRMEERERRKAARKLFIDGRAA